MRRGTRWLTRLLLGILLAGSPSCKSGPPRPPLGDGPRAGGDGLETGGDAAGCEYVEEGYGPDGQVPVRAETVASGLEVPWGLAFLPGGDMLVTERPGRVRLIRAGQLQQAPVATVPLHAGGEGGLLGIAAHPDFARNRLFYLYYTAAKDGAPVNRIERFQLSADGRSATAERILLDDIPAAAFHNGGRLRVGPDGMLYAGTGDAREPRLSQDPGSLAGKLLRLTPAGGVPDDNPIRGRPALLSGIRNTQGFAWPDGATLWVTDHGPSGEMGLTGHDEVSVARAGDNLGWPAIHGCAAREGLVRPVLSWRTAVPPGGAAIYTGTAIPEWRGSLLIGTLGSRHLHRVVIDAGPRARLHEVYFRGEPPGGLGRLREVIMGPDGALYVTTSNCDGRGRCPPERDRIVRVTR